MSAKRQLTADNYTSSGRQSSIGHPTVPKKEYTACMQHETLPIIVESDQDGYFVACPALQGCYSEGATYEEAIANIKDAIRLHVEDRLAGGEEIPHPASVSLSTVEVAV